MEALTSTDLQLMSRDHSYVCSHLSADSDPSSESTGLFSVPRAALFYLFTYLKAAVLIVQRVPDFNLMSYRLSYPSLLIAWRDFSMSYFQSRSGIIPYSVSVKF